MENAAGLGHTPGSGGVPRWGPGPVPGQ